MKRKILIEPAIDDYQAVRFYMLRFEDENETEFDKFCDEFDGDEEYGANFDVIIEWLDRIGDDGALDVHLRPEGGSLKALPINHGRLRLYCFRVSECVVLLGNGGIKHKHIKAYQDDPFLNQCVSDLREVGRKLITRIKNTTKTGLHNCELFGDLVFEIETSTIKRT